MTAAGTGPRYRRRNAGDAGNLSARGAHRAQFGRLFRYLRQKGLPHEDAEDLIQEATLRLHVYRQKATVINEEAFLRRTIKNLSIDKHRHDRNDLRQHVSIDDVGIEIQMSTAIGPEQIVEMLQRLETINALLEARSIRLRKIFMAQHAGYTRDEIANYLGISHITVRRHIARGRVTVMNAEANAAE